MIDIRRLLIQAPWPLNLHVGDFVRVEIDETLMTCRVTADTISRPSAPSGFNFSALGNGIFLDWLDNPVSETVTKYSVYRAAAQGGPYSLVSDSVPSSYTDLSASANVPYWYHVTATNLGGESSYSEISAFYLVDSTPPGVPSITSTTQAGVNAVKIDWTPPVDADLAGFNVYRSTSSGGTYTKLNTLGLLSNSTYTDTAATAGTHWYYHVTSVDQTGNESAAAATDFNVPASDTTPPAVPTSVTGLDIHSAIRITWASNGEPDFASYKLYRSDDAYTTAVATGLTVATYDDATAVVGTPYSYKVLARDTTGNESAKSMASSATTRTTAPANGNLTPFTNTGVGLMVPAVAHCRGVNFTKYRAGSTFADRVPVYTETADFSPQLAAGNELTARYEWNMVASSGNPQGLYSTGRGFNFAHVYDEPGTYTATLTRTDENGKVDTYQTTLVAQADNRKVVYCSSNGDSSASNTGTDKTKPVNLARAASILQASNAVKVLLQRGDSFNISGTSFTLAKDQQMISSSIAFVKAGASTGALPILNISAAPPDSSFRYFIAITSTSHNAVVENLVFDRSYTAGNSTYLQDVGVQIIGAGNALVRNITFKKIGKPLDVDQSSATTRYVLVQDCSCPNTDSMQYNFLFVKGADYCFFGLKTHDSIQEHALRLSQVDRVNIMSCDLRIATQGKNPINAQQGSMWYISKSAFTTEWTSPFAGDVQIGPLNKTTATLEAFCKLIVMEDCTCQTFVQIEDGASFVMIRNCKIGQDGSYSFEIYGHGEGLDQYGQALNARLNHHIYIYNNTLVNAGKTTQVVRVKYGFDNFECSNNLLIAPGFVQADGGSLPTAAMYFGGLGASNIVSRNIIPFAFDRLKKGSSFITTAQFNTSGGTNNATDAVTIDANAKPTFTKGQATLSRPVKGVFSSINGTSRLQSDASWTPGAYQL